MSEVAGEALLAVEGLEVIVGGRCLFVDLRFEVRPGERWCVLGPNGSGKTRLIETLTGFHRPASGTLRYGGRPLAALTAREAARWRALLPQHAADPFDATVFELACTGRHPHLAPHGWESAADRALVMRALDAVELSDAAARSIHSLSGGERQRLALATVLAQQTPLLLLDEPFNHLDLRQQAVVMRRLLDAGMSATVGLVCSLHDLNLASRLATHLILLDGKGGAWCGPSAAILREDRLSQAFGTTVVRHGPSGAGWWSALDPA